MLGGQRFSVNEIQIQIKHIIQIVTIGLVRKTFVSQIFDRVQAASQYKIYSTYTCQTKAYISAGVDISSTFHTIGNICIYTIFQSIQSDEAATFWEEKFEMDEGAESNRWDT